MLPTNVIGWIANSPVVGHNDNATCMTVVAGFELNQCCSSYLDHCSSPILTFTQLNQRGIIVVQLGPKFCT
jgi:hypothetical protein